MIILALETATAACSAALLIGNKIHQKLTIAPQQHSDLILGFIETLLQESNLALSDVDVIAFGCGPGSFMGVRLAVGIAQGLAYSVDCPVVPVSTLRGLAHSAFEKSGNTFIVPGWDARLQAIYWGAYTIDAQHIPQSVIPDQLQDPADTVIEVDHPWIAAGNAWSIYSEQLPLQLQQKITILSEIIYPEAASIARIAAVLYKNGEYLPPDQATPVYLRDKVAKPAG